MGATSHCLCRHQKVPRQARASIDFLASPLGHQRVASTLKVVGSDCDLDNGFDQVRLARLSTQTNSIDIAIFDNSAKNASFEVQAYHRDPSFIKVSKEEISEECTAGRQENPMRLDFLSVRPLESHVGEVWIRERVLVSHQKASLYYRRFWLQQNAPN
jgi:hypothetical protein